MRSNILTPSSRLLLVAIFSCSFLIILANPAPAMEIAKLKAADAAEDDRLGTHPGLAIDGDTVIVGAQPANKDFNSSGSGGAAYVFQQDQGGPNNWGEVVELAPTLLGGFGNYQSIDGDTAVVAARTAEAGCSIGCWAVYIFERDTGGADNWGQVKQLISPDASNGRFFGQSAVLSGDTVFVGETGPAGNIGRVRIFERDEGGLGNWGFVKTIENPDPADGDQFGISIDGEGDTLVVGASGDSGNKGAIYVFERNLGDADTWGLRHKRTGTDSAAGDNFSFTSLGLSGDVIVVGSANVGANAAYVFERDEGGTDNWGQIKKLTASAADPGDSFGFAVAVDGDLIVSSAVSDDDDGENRGAAYLFGRDKGGSGNWGEIAKFTPSDIDDVDLFGHSAAISDDLIVVASQRDDD